MLYLFQSKYRSFLIPCYDIIQRTVFSFVIIIIVFMFILKYLFIVLRHYYCWVYFYLIVKSVNHLSKFPLPSRLFRPPPPPPPFPAYFILPNFPTPTLLRTPFPPFIQHPRITNIFLVELKELPCFQSC